MSEEGQCGLEETPASATKKSGKKNKQKHHGGGAPERRGDMNIAQDVTQADGEAEQPKEKDSGVPYIIKSSDVMGRYLVASRDIRQGELILTADPLVVGPPQGCQPMCLGCYKKLELEDNPYRCSGCGWPMCGKGCSGKGKEYGHSEAECRLYESACSKLVSMTETRLTSLYLVVVPLRCLLLETINPEKYRILLTMEAHNDVRRGLPCIWKNNQENVVDRIRLELGFTQFEEEMIHTVCGFLEVNAFEVGQNDISIRALYPHAFYLAHDCVPNTGHTDDKNFTLRIRATIRIPKGDSINLSYAYTLQGTLKRREHLKESKFFDCKCARCSDLTELGTYAGALKCPMCNGVVLSTQPLDNAAEWRCNNSACKGYIVPGRSVKQLMERIGDEAEGLDENSVPDLEAFLTRYQNVLHPNHYHYLGILHSLSQLYGKAPGYIINSMNETQLSRKRDICRQLLKVVDVLEPGYSRLRGVLLYELHAPLMILITRGVESRTLNCRDLKSRLKEVAACLEESSQILSFEPDTSHEGIMGAAAKDALIRVQEWQKIISNGY